MSLHGRWSAALDEVRGQHRYRTLRTAAGIDFTSNDYLGYGRAGGVSPLVSGIGMNPGGSRPPLAIRTGTSSRCCAATTHSGTTPNPHWPLGMGPKPC